MTVVINGSSGITNDGGYTGDGVVFADTTPANTLVTTTGGNVGIGTSSPSGASGTTLAINGGAGQARLALKNTSSGDAAGDGLQIALDNTAGGIEMRENLPLYFTTNNIERARIDTSGNLLVGKTTSSSSTAGLILYGQSTISGYGRIDFGKTVSGTVTGAEFANSGTPVGTITYSNTATAYNTSSDYRLKHDIAPMTGALDRVAALKPVTYKWNADESVGEGFIAHELQAVVPDCVTGEKDGVETYTDEDGNEQTRPVYQGIDTSFLVATLTAAIQEQQAIITALTARVAALEGK